MSRTLTCLDSGFVASGWIFSTCALNLAVAQKLSPHGLRHLFLQPRYLQRKARSPICSMMMALLIFNLPLSCNSWEIMSEATLSSQAVYEAFATYLMREYKQPGSADQFLTASTAVAYLRAIINRSSARFKAVGTDSSTHEYRN